MLSAPTGSVRLGSRGRGMAPSPPAVLVSGPVPPDAGVEHLLDKAVQGLAEHHRRGRQLMIMREPHGQAHLGQLVSVGAEVFLQRQGSGHVVPVAAGQPGEIIDMPDMPDLLISQERDPEFVRRCWPCRRRCHWSSARTRTVWVFTSVAGNPQRIICGF